MEMDKEDVESLERALIIQAMVGGVDEADIEQLNRVQDRRRSR